MSVDQRTAQQIISRILQSYEASHCRCKPKPTKTKLHKSADDVFFSVCLSCGKTDPKPLGNTKELQERYVKENAMIYHWNLVPAENTLNNNQQTNTPSKMT
jgi:Fe2+ or Zn2+ uptake regulation protein